MSWLNRISLIGNVKVFTILTNQCYRYLMRQHTIINTLGTHNIVCLYIILTSIYFLTTSSISLRCTLSKSIIRMFPLASNIELSNMEIVYGILNKHTRLSARFAVWWQMQALKWLDMTNNIWLSEDNQRKYYGLHGSSILRCTRKCSIL